MGQQIGKASFEEDAKPFLNLSAPAINAVWTAFNLSAESWGLRASSFVNICRPLAPFLGFDDPTMQTKANALFTLFDTDLNGIVDALEFMGSLAMVSAMEPSDKIKFVYTVYDFSEKGSLLVDEITLAIKSTVEGLCKISKLPPPGVEACESMARLAFAANGKAAVVTSGGVLTLAEFLAYVDANPTSASWMGYFDDIPDSADEAPPPAQVNVSPTYPVRSAIEASFLAGRGAPASLGPKTGGGEWYRPPVVDESYIPGEGDDEGEDGEGEGGAVKYLDPGTPCYAVVQQLLKPDEMRRTVITAPDSQLVLDWVHGVSTLCRDHVKYCGVDEGSSVVYPAGSVGVQYRFPNEEEDNTEAAQRHFTDHADSITALAVAPPSAASSRPPPAPGAPGAGVASSSSSPMVATADCRTGFGGPRVMLWRAGKDKNSPAGVLGGAGLWTDGCPPFALDFSPDGTKLLALAKAGGGSSSSSNSSSKDGSSGAGAGTNGGAGGASSFVVTVHDVRSKQCVFALTTNSSSYGTVFASKWCATVEPSTYAAKGGVRSTGAQGSFALATSKGIVFFSPTPGGATSYEPRKGIAGSRTKVESLLSLCALEEPEVMACGGMSGNLYRYEGRNVAECVSAHSAPVTCLKFVPAAHNLAGGSAPRVFSGSLDCTVKVWDAVSFQAVATLDLMALGSSLGREVTSLDVGGNGAKCLVATSAAEVWELSAVGGGGSGDPEDGGGGGEGGGEGGEDVEGPGKSLHPGGGPLFNGHFGVRGSGLVTCLAGSPSTGEYASGGADGTLRIYDAASHQVARMQQITAGVQQSGAGGGGLRCLAYSPDGSRLAAAVGGSVEIFDPLSLDARVARLPSDADDTAVGNMSPVQLVRFSPGGNSLAVLSENAVLSVYLAESWSLTREVDLAQHLPSETLKPPAKSKGSVGPGKQGSVSVKSRCPGVCDLDVSEDGNWVQVGTHTLETFYFSVESGKPAAEPALATLRSAGARFPSCGPGPSKIAFEKQGSHPPHCSPADVTVCCANPEARLQLCGDAWGGVHLFNYPAAAPATQGQTWQCHSPGVNGACFVSGDEFVATCGSTDLAVYQWKLDVDEVRDRPKELDKDELAALAAGDDDDDDDDDGGGGGGPKLQDVEDAVESGEDYLAGAALAQSEKPPLFHALVTRDPQAASSLVAEASSARDKTTGGNPYAKTCALFEPSVAPTFQPVPPQEPPKDGLSLEWVYGMAAQGVRGGVRYNALGEVVYPAASLAVVLNKGNNPTPASSSSSGGGGKASSGGGDKKVSRRTTPSPARAAVSAKAAASKEGGGEGDGDEEDENQQQEGMTQRYLAAHTEAVTCLAMHPGGVLCATGQRGPKPFVALSDTLTGAVVLRLEPALPEGVDAGAITAVAFSPDGSLVAFATCDQGNFTLHVFGTEDGTLRCQGPSGGEGKVLGLAWAPDDSGRILACGVEHFNLWFCRGRTLARKRGVFGESAVKQTLLCCAWMPGSGGEEGSEPVGVLGAQDGSLFKLEGRSVSEVVEKFHSGGVTALYGYKPFEDDGGGGAGACLCSGGRDGVVKLMGPDLEPLVTINLRDQEKYGCYRWHVKSVCLNKDGRKVLVGTNGSEVLEISATEEAVDINGGALVTGHCRKGLKSVAPHPMQPEFATVGEDRTVRVWSVGDKKLSRMLSLSGEACSCCYSPDGYLVAVGMADGSVQVVSLLKPELDVVKELKSEGVPGPVTAVKFSPNGKVVAAATDAGVDGSRVVFYDCENTSTPGGAFTLKSKFLLTAVSDAARKASSSSGADGGGSVASGAGGGGGDVSFLLATPTAMDFTSDSNALQVTTTLGLAFVNVENGACVGVSAASSLAVTRSGNGQPPPTPLEACQAILKAGAMQFRDESWASYSVPSGWLARGVFPPCAGPQDVVTVCRGTSSGGTLACTSDAFGTVSLVSWPCPSPDPQAASSGGSSSSSGGGIGGVDGSSVVSGDASAAGAESVEGAASASAGAPGGASADGDAASALDGSVGGAGDGGSASGGGGASAGGGAAAVKLLGGGEAPKRRFFGHGAAMGGACFVVGDTHVVSIGLEDRCVFQWATGKPTVEEVARKEAEDARLTEQAKAKAEAAAKRLEEGGEGGGGEEDDWEAEEAEEARKKVEEEEAAAAEAEAFTDPDVVLELRAKPPPRASLAAAPDLAKLSFVQGLSTFAGGAHVNADGHVVHAAGSLGLVYLKKRHAQLVFPGHHHTPTAVAAPAKPGSSAPGAPNVRVLACENDVGFRFGACAASGDASGSVCVWDACTAAQRCVLPPGLHNQPQSSAAAAASTSSSSSSSSSAPPPSSSEVCALGFSHGSHKLGSLLVSVGSDPRHTLGVWQSPKRDWTDPVLVAAAQCGTGLVTFCAWAASAGSAFSGGKKGKLFPKEQYDFAVGGTKGKGSGAFARCAVQFWTLAAGNVKCVYGTYADGLVPEELVVCGVGLGKSGGEGRGHLQLLATGGASGRLLLWEGTTCVRVTKGHDSAVTDLKMAPLDVSPRRPQDAAPGRYQGRVGLVSCGLDGFVKVWAVTGLGGEASLALSSEFDLASECVPRPLRSSACAVAVDGAFTKLLVVTASSELVEVVRDSRATVQLLAAHAPATTDGSGPALGPAQGSGGGNGGGGVSGGVARGCCSPVAPHPNEPDLLASGGSDGTVRVWSRSGRCGLAVLEIGSPVSAVCWLPDPPDAAETGASGGLLVCLAPTGSLVHVSADLGTMVLSKARVVSPSQTPVPTALLVDLEGKLIKTSSPGFKQPSFLELSNGKPVAEVATATKATWFGEGKGLLESSGGSDPDGACLFMYY